jgi:hypothetical protein
MVLFLVNAHQVWHTCTGLPTIVWRAESDWPSSWFTSGSFFGETGYSTATVIKQRRVRWAERVARTGKEPTYWMLVGKLSLLTAWIGRISGSEVVNWIELAQDWVWSLRSVAEPSGAHTRDLAVCDWTLKLYSRQKAGIFLSGSNARPGFVSIRSKWCWLWRSLLFHHLVTQKLCNGLFRVRNKTITFRSTNDGSASRTMEKAR